MKKIIAVLLVTLIVAGAVFAEGGKEAGGAKKWRIAFSNDYAGNSWRQQMLKDWDTVVTEAKEKGLIEEAPAFTTNESSAAEQAAQIQNLILEGYDAIVLDAASPTALNGAIQKAIDAGIPVISFDNAVTLDAAYKLITDFQWYGEREVEYLAERLKGGKLLEIRGLAGTFVNDAIHEGIMNGMAKHPEFEIVGEVYGNWTQSVAQKEVAGILPSLPEIVGVVTQGGDGYGAIKAFEAAGRPIPIVYMGNRQDELQIWKDLNVKNGYETESSCIPPASVQVAFWTALEVLNGNDVPKKIMLPPMSITADTLDIFLQITPKGAVASNYYPQSWVQELISNAKAGKPAPTDPVPEI